MPKYHEWTNTLNLNPQKRDKKISEVRYGGKTPEQVEARHRVEDIELLREMQENFEEVWDK